MNCELGIVLGEYKWLWQWADEFIAETMLRALVMGLMEGNLSGRQLRAELEIWLFCSPNELKFCLFRVQMKFNNIGGK